MTKFYLLLILLLSISGCSKSGLIERKIGQRADECQPGAKCVIAISELTDFKWDKMFVFDVGVRSEEITKTIGVPLPGYDEFKRSLVFLKDDKLVYSEIEPTDIEGIVDRQVAFNPSRNDLKQMFTPETAVFTAEKKSGAGGKIFYFLIQVSQTKPQLK